MELRDYLDSFLKSLNRNNIDFTNFLEKEGQELRRLIKNYSGNPSNLELQRVSDFLVNIEKWKADCREEQTGNAIRNAPGAIWSAIKQAINTSDDKIALLSVMGLTGFGVLKDRETGQRRAKRATAVMRFLDPDNWGVVDWRVIAILGFYRKNYPNIDLALQEAQKYKMSTIAQDYDLINESMAIEIEMQYRRWRTPKLPRAVDVEFALYGASFVVWPRN